MPKRKPVGELLPEGKSFTIRDECWKCGTRFPTFRNACPNCKEENPQDEGKIAFNSWATRQSVGSFQPKRTHESE